MKKYLITVCFGVLFMITCLFAKNYSMADVRTYRGIEGRITDIGSGVGYFYQFQPLGPIQFQVSTSWLSITGGQEYKETYYDYYTKSYYQITINEVSLDFIKVGTSAKYHLFKEQIANAFSPFAMVQAGGVLALDTPENKSFSTKINNIVSYGGFYSGIYGGIDFKASGPYGFTIAAGYEYNLFEKMIDNRSSWDGVTVILQYGKIR